MRKRRLKIRPRLTVIVTLPYVSPPQSRLDIDALIGSNADKCQWVVVQYASSGGPREGASVRLFPTETTALTAPTRYRSTVSGIWIRIVARPTTVFIVLSLVFGGLIISGTPPLRGPDEISHFVRIYSYARGEILPSTEVDGRKGILVEPGLYSELQFFRTAGEVFAREGGLSYPPLVAGYRNPIGSTADEPDQARIFAPFAGTEGYNPVAYIPYIAAAAIGRLFKLDFSDMLLFMRWFGLATFTAIAAYAIAVIPTLKWAFVLIALLPVSLYNRSVLSADGAALSTALVITALCLRAAAGSTVGRVWERSLWMTLCALSKQPQIVFLLLELMVYRVKELPRQWLRISSVVLPSVILSPMWVVLVSAEVGAWRLQEEGHHPPEHFDPLWKLFYMWEHPYHFPLAAWRAVSGWGDRLWRELIGIVGWQDILLPTWTYLVLTALLFLVPLQKLQVSGATRARVAVISGLVVLSYVILVYLIFYLTYTPLDVDHVRGVQGRYFVIVLPVAAIFVATVINRELPSTLPSAIAITGSVIAGVATVESLFRAHL